MKDNYACLILAAGYSRRFGAPKMQHPLENGLSILQNTVLLYTKVFDNVSVVIQPQDNVLRNSLANYSVRVIENPNANLGLSQSIVAGVQQLPLGMGCLIALGDMPFVSPDTLELMQKRMQTAASENIIAPSVNGRIGNPVAFGAAYREDLLGLKGDVGAKPIMQACANSVLKIDVQDRGIFWDIDTADDLAENASS